MNHVESIEFLVGAERSLSDVLKEPDVLPLLRAAVSAGAERAWVRCGAHILWQWPLDAPLDATADTGSFHSASLRLEGEQVAELRVEGTQSVTFAEALAHMTAAALNTTISANLKRMLTTEIHTQVVSQAYEDLLAVNRRLSASENKYRVLAESLEDKVKERTAELERAWACLLRQEKLAAVGQLAAGMAHEINNPLGFILSNLNTFQKYVGRYQAMLDYYRRHMGVGLTTELQEAVEGKWKELRLDFIADDLNELLPQCIAGAERIKQIIADLRGFAHIDKPEVSALCLTEALERTLAVMHAEIPDDALIHHDLSALPKITGQGALLCQAFMNLIRNALQACPQGLILDIRGSLHNAEVLLIFSDNGPGIAEDIRERIYEPFFTTRDVGQGIGLGLTVVHDAVQAFRGRIETATGPRGGAEFRIFLPVSGAADG